MRRFNSTLDFDATQDVEWRQTGQITLLYAAPERLNTPRFLACWTALYDSGNLSLFAIDEAHCVSQWGHDFRPEYRALTLLHERWPAGAAHCAHGHGRCPHARRHHRAAAAAGRAPVHQQL